MVRECLVGLDLGNTWFRSCVVTSDGELIVWRRSEVDRSRNLDQSIEQVFSLVETVLSRSTMERGKLRMAGISFGGLTDHDRGVALLSHNLLAWKDVSLCRLFEERFGIRAVMDNDGNLGALAEHTFGEMRGIKDFIYGTLSTGIGGGLILNGGLYRGSRNLAGEIGHIQVLENGPRCTCGKRGCLESLASGSSLARFAREGDRSNGEGEEKKGLGLIRRQYRGHHAKTLDLAARQRDPFSIRFLQDAGRYVVRAIAQTVVLLDLELVVVGGGVGNAGRILFDPLRETLNARLLPEPLASIRVVRSRLGDSIGLLGSIALAHKELETC